MDRKTKQKAMTVESTLWGQREDERSGRQRIEGEAESRQCILT